MKRARLIRIVSGRAGITPEGEIPQRVVLSLTRENGTQLWLALEPGLAHEIAEEVLVLLEPAPPE